ncbi:MAG: type II toxin-antitoxin system RelE/ParE family toxin [Chloroflexi bacterium]|nr:type II toxin-antitoxin system RelE/ParE family toxin [Chloroflexota bacterium]
MSYRAIYLPRASGRLRRMDASEAQRIMRKIKWLAENQDLVTPKALTGEFKGLFKLRVGDYRALYSVSHNEQLIAIHFINHRKDVYKSK